MGATHRLLIASLLAAATHAACTAGGATLPQRDSRAAAQSAPIPVTTASVVQKSMPIEMRVIGTATPYSTVAVRAQTAGQLTSVTFNEGDEVTKGQVLFTIDRRPLESALEQAEANLERDVAQSEHAKGQAKRYQELAQRGLATPEQVDQNNSTATALEGTIRADRASIQNAKLQLEYATIAAPISGRTGALMVNPGNLVQPGQATPLVVINQVSPIYVSFGVPEARLSELKHYMTLGTLKVEAELPNEEGRRSGGRLSFLDNAVDQATGTIKIKGAFPNEDRRFWPGQFVNVVLTLTTIPAAIVVPSSAVQIGQQGRYVFVVKADQSVEVRPVTVTQANDADTVVASGLTPDEVVVSTGQLRLVPGSRISVKAGGSAVTP